MMNKVFFILFSLICISSQAQELESNIVSDEIDSTRILLKEKFGNSISDDCKINANFHQVLVYGLGNVKIYSGKVKTISLPEDGNQWIKFYLLKDANKAQRLLILDSLFYVKTLKTNDSCYLGGLRFKKFYSRIYLYEFHEGYVKEIFESDEYVYNYSLDCNSYNRRGFLKFNNKDINGDGYADLQFSGIRFRFCSLTETGFNRTNRKRANRKFKLEFNYLFRPDTGSWKRLKMDL